MTKVNYDKIVPGLVEPKLAYHGFRYDQNESYAPQGHYCFTRTYWCTTQRVSICPVEYDSSDIEIVLGQTDDTPTEVPQPLLLIREPGFRMWLSNKYILGVLECEHKSVNLLPNEGISNASFDVKEIVKKLRTSPPPEAGQKLPTWWEFHGEDGLRRVLDEMVQIVVLNGLDWFEAQISDVRRHHEKLDRRRLAVKNPKSANNI
jgi:hypothetical protein